MENINNRLDNSYSLTTGTEMEILTLTRALENVTDKVILKEMKAIIADKEVIRKDSWDEYQDCIVLLKAEEDMGQVIRDTEQAQAILDAHAFHLKSIEVVEVVDTKKTKVGYKK